MDQYDTQRAGHMHRLELEHQYAYAQQSARIVMERNRTLVGKLRTVEKWLSLHMGSGLTEQQKSATRGMLAEVRQAIIDHSQP